MQESLLLAFLNSFSTRGEKRVRAGFYSWWSTGRVHLFPQSCSSRREPERKQGVYEAEHTELKCDSLNMMSHILSPHAQSTSSSPNCIYPIHPHSIFLNTDPSVKMSLPVPPGGPWKSARAPRHSIHPIPLPLFEALEAGDLERASSIAALTPFLVSETNRGLWGRRLALAAGDAEHLPWLSRLVVYKPERDLEVETSHIKRPEAVLVGRIGFHGKPDERGIVEVGYEIDPQQRRCGHAKAAMRIMVDVARLIPGINVLRASVVPEYWISRRVVESEGLRKVGAEVSSRHGLQDVFEIDVSN